MAASATHNGWRWDRINSRLDFYYRGTRVGHLNASGMTIVAGKYLTGAPVEMTITTKAADATLTTAEAGIILCSTDNTTMTLPSVTGNAGLRYIFKATPTVSTGITVAGTIDGQTNQVLYDQYETLDIVCDATSWHII